MWQEDVPAIIARRDVMEQSDMSLTTLKSAPIVPIENYNNKSVKLCTANYIIHVSHSI